MRPSSNEIQSALEQARTNHVFSGYQLYSECKGIALSIFGGDTSFWQPSLPVTEDSLFDLGSVTKVVATTSLFALGVQQKQFDLGDSLSKSLPEFQKSGYASLTLGQLLSHCAGIISWYPLYRETSAKGLKAWFLRNDKKICIDSPGTKSVYSDLGMLLLGFVLEKGGDFRKQYLDRVAGPLKLKGVDYPPFSDTSACVATEYCEEREVLLQGQVFDRNANHLGGVCPHAGLFASARSLGPWCNEWLKAWHGKSKWLRQDASQLFSRVTGIVSGSTRAYGWDTKSAVHASAGRFFSSKSFGHLGYTGTSVWIDPEKEMFSVFLTNRVHPSRYDDRIREVRPRVHELLTKYWEN